MLINQVDNAFPFSSFIPFYTNGLGIKNNATTPLTQLDIAPGTCLDSTGTFQLQNNAVVTINAANNGLNGLDTGTFAEAKVYAVYLVADPVAQQVTGAMISLNLVTPLLPFGYSAYALIGYAVTISNAANFLKAYWSDNDANRRVCTFDAPQATAITAGASNTYANVNLITLVPNIPNVEVQVYTSLTGTAAGNILNLQAGNATGAQATITVQVASIAVTSISNILAQPVTIGGIVSPVINYEVTNTSAVAIDVAGFVFDL